MTTSCQEVLAELRNVTTIDLTYKAVSTLEKIIWGLIGVTGTVWAVYFISLQFLSWEENPSILLQGNINEAKIKYPAITICPKVAPIYAIAERLGNFIDPSNVPQELMSLRHDYFLSTIGKGILDNLELNEKHDYYKSFYSGHCLNIGSFLENYEKGCKVRNTGISICYI